jgi:hypothetical protein
MKTKTKFDNSLLVPIALIVVLMLVCVVLAYWMSNV